jgi:hypothetical protein
MITDTQMDCYLAAVEWLLIRRAEAGPFDLLQLYDDAVIYTEELDGCDEELKDAQTWNEMLYQSAFVAARFPQFTSRPRRHWS